MWPRSVLRGTILRGRGGGLGRVATMGNVLRMGEFRYLFGDVGRFLRKFGFVFGKFGGLVGIHRGKWPAVLGKRPLLCEFR